MGSFDYVLLSHDHHFDNLDHSGRTSLARAGAVITTDEGAQRLGGNSKGLKAWESIDLGPNGDKVLCVVATSAQHGPAGLNRGAVTGFVLHSLKAPERATIFRETRFGFPAWLTLRSDFQFGLRSSILALRA